MEPPGEQAFRASNTSFVNVNITKLPSSGRVAERADIRANIAVIAANSRRFSTWLTEKEGWRVSSSRLIHNARVVHVQPRGERHVYRGATCNVRRVGRATGVSRLGRVFMAEKIFYHNNTKIRCRGRLCHSLSLSFSHAHTHTHTLFFFSLSLYLCLFRTIAVQMSSSRIQRIKENSASPVCSLDVVSFPRKDSKGRYVEEAIGSPDYQKVIRISIGIVDFFSGFYTGPSVHGVPPCAAGTGVGLHRRNRAAAVMHANEA